MAVLVQNLVSCFNLFIQGQGQRWSQTAIALKNLTESNYDQLCGLTRQQVESVGTNGRRWMPQTDAVNTFNNNRCFVWLAHCNSVSGRAVEIVFTNHQKMGRLNRISMAKAYSWYQALSFAGAPSLQDLVIFIGPQGQALAWAISGFWYCDKRSAINIAQKNFAIQYRRYSFISALSILLK